MCVCTKKNHAVLMLFGPCSLGSVRQGRDPECTVVPRCPGGFSFVWIVEDPVLVIGRTKKLPIVDIVEEVTIRTSCSRSPTAAYQVARGVVGPPLSWWGCV